VVALYNFTPGKGLDASQEVIIELNLFAGVLDIAGLAAERSSLRTILRIESGIDARQPHKLLTIKTAAGQQHQRQRNLGHHQQIPDSTTGPPPKFWFFSHRLNKVCLELRRAGNSPVMIPLINVRPIVTARTLPSTPTCSMRECLLLLFRSRSTIQSASSKPTLPRSRRAGNFPSKAA